MELLVSTLLSVDNHVLVLPLVSSKCDFIAVKRKFFKTSGKVTIRILDPIPTDGMDKADVNDLVENVRNQMQEVLNEISPTDEDAKKDQ